VILDRLSQAHLYRGIHPLLAAALDWLKDADLTGLPLGKTVIDGERLFALVQEYEPRPPEQLKFEAHRRYWDVQVVAAGQERMGWAPLADLEVSESYDEGRDVAFYRGSGQFVLVPQRSFTVFAPSDAHMPGVVADGAELVRKIVVKAAIGAG